MRVAALLASCAVLAGTAAASKMAWVRDMLGAEEDALSLASARSAVAKALKASAQPVSESQASYLAGALVRSLDWDGDRHVSAEELERAAVGDAFRAGPLLPLDPPQQVHLSLTGDPSAMTVMWVTTHNYTGAGCVFWPAAGGDGQGDKRIAAATITSYSFGLWVPWKGAIYTATMTGLVPGAAYEYRVGSPGSSWSQDFSFRAAPAPAAVKDGVRPTSFLTYGDMGARGRDSQARSIR